MISIALNSYEVNEDIQEKLNEIETELNELLGYTTSEVDVSLEAAEVRVSNIFSSLEQKTLEVYANKKAGEQESEPVECPACQQPCDPLRIQQKHFTTLCGKIGVHRWVYRCEQGHRHAPWDAKQKLLDKYTHRVAEIMCRFAAHLDFREAASELSRQGIKVSHTTLQKKVVAWLEALNVCEQVGTQTLQDTEKWYVSCDGCWTNSPDGWKATKVGSVYKDYPQPSSGSTPSARTSSIRYVAGRQNAERFGKDLYALAIHSGIYQEDIDTQEIVFIGDGAAWIWNLADEYFPNAVEIVDYMHAVSHLSNLAKTAFGETETEAVQTWIKEIKPILCDGNIPEVVARIRAIGTDTPEVSEVLEREAKYFEKHAKRMRSKAFREKGYQIGSGVIESACKHVVGQRCPQASMRCEEPGINAVLKWKCLYKNKTWDNYWYPNTKAA